MRMRVCVGVRGWGEEEGGWEGREEDIPGSYRVERGRGGRGDGSQGGKTDHLSQQSREKRSQRRFAGVSSHTPTMFRPSPGLPHVVTHVLLESPYHLRGWSSKANASPPCVIAPSHTTLQGFSEIGGLR